MTFHRLFYPALLLKALLMIFIILFAGIGLGPDEAQYWTWSRKLDVGYYSKPPGIAWQIFLSTGLFGATELGVRFSAVVMGTLLSIAVYHLAEKAGCPKNVSALAGLVMAASPVGIFSTYLAITDGGLLLFWTLGLSELIGKNSYLRFGFFIACGALFKWPIYLLWVVALVLWIYKPEIRNKTVILGFLISLLGLLPTLIWNINHDFATFRHVINTVQGAQEGNRGNPLEFIGSQIALSSPVFFALACVAAFRLRQATPSIAFLGMLSLCILGIYTGYSIFKKGQGNWCLFVYPSFFVWVTACSKEKFILWGIALSLALCIGLFAFQSYLPWKMNPFRPNLGWARLEAALKSFDPKKEFLLADKYQITSLLSFYNPYQEQAYFINLFGMRKNQFSYWPRPEKGKNALFVAVEANFNEDVEEYSSLLSPYFEKIHPFKVISLVESEGKSVKKALIIPCESYNGRLPEDPEKY